MEWWQEQLFEGEKSYLQEKTEALRAYYAARMAPHIVQNAQIMKDGTRWLCVLGDKHTGVVGFGDTPEQACAEFDRVWKRGFQKQMANENRNTADDKYAEEDTMQPLMTR